jgi:hypothetical protein
MQNNTRDVWMIRLSMIMSLLVIAPGMLQAVEVDAGKLTVNVHGFLSQGYLKSNANNFLADTKDGTFEFREYGLNISSNLTDRLRIGAQVFGRDFGDYGNNTPTLDWGFADYRLQDWLGIRGGRMKIWFGLYNQTRDIDLVRTSLFLPESIYNDAFRESFIALDGVSLYGDIPLWNVGTLSYQGQWGRIHMKKDAGFADAITEYVPMSITELETSDVYVAGLEFVPASPLDGLRLRWSWNDLGLDLTGATNAAYLWQIQGIPPGLPLTYHADLNITVLSAEYRWGDLVLAAETFAPGRYANKLASPIFGTVYDDTPDKVGYYGSAAYSVTDWFECGLAYSEYYNNTHDKDGTGNHTFLGFPYHHAWLKDTTMSTRFDFREDWVLKLEGHFMDGTDVMLTSDNPNGTQQKWFLFAAKVTYNF